MQAPEPFSSFQCQFRIQNLSNLSSGLFPIQMTWLCQIITLGTHVESFVRRDFETLLESSFSRKRFPSQLTLRQYVLRP